MQRPSERDRTWFATAAIVVVALLTRAAFAWLVPMGPAWDGVLYERGARAIANGLGYSTFMYVHRSSDTVPTAFYPVGYPAFVALLYAVLHPSVAILRAGGIAVSAASVGFAHRLALRAASRPLAHAAALLLALLPGQVIFASAAMTEPLFGFLLVLAVYFLVRTPPPLRTRDLVGFALATAAATYVRPQAVLLAAVLPLARPSALARGARGRIVAAAIACGICAVCIAPWSARNCARLDGCVFVSANGGANLAIGALPRSHGTFFFLQPSDGCAGVVGEAHRDRCWRGVALREIAAHPWHWIELAPAKIEHTLAYETFPASYLRESLRIDTTPRASVARLTALGAPVPNDAEGERRLGRWLSASWRVLLDLALLAFVPLAVRAPLAETARIAALACALVLATHVLVFGGDRYHLPLAPLLAVLVAAAFRGIHSPRFRRVRFVLTHVRVRDEILSPKSS